jgi:hypothetical protein
MDKTAMSPANPVDTSDDSTDDDILRVCRLFFELDNKQIEVFFTKHYDDTRYRFIRPKDPLYKKFCQTLWDEFSKNKLMSYKLTEISRGCIKEEPGTTAASNTHDIWR